MKTLTALICTLLVSGIITNAHAADKLHHVVCFKFKTTAATPDIKKVEEAFQALQKQISQVQSLKWGTNVSKEKRDKGFTHCFLLSFKSEADRDAYIEHPAHKAFGKLVGPVLDDVFVLDFWAKD
jgi:Stress responsive A/B Barrel Domain